MFFFPLFDDNPTGRRPFVSWTILILCILGFFWQLSLTGSAANHSLYQLGFVPALVLSDATLPSEIVLVPAWMTIFTSMFLHGGWMHIGGNMLYLWIFGDNVEDAMGPVKFIIFYALCGVAAAFAQGMIDPESTIPMIGASGGIAGVLGAYIMLHPKASVRTFMLIFVFFRFINLPAWLVLGVWIAGQFVAVPQALAGNEGGVAYMAHIGGFLAGMALIPLFKNRNIALFDRALPPQRWSGEPISFATIKSEAKQRYRRDPLGSRILSTPSSKPTKSGSVPGFKRPSDKKSPWG
ncbi:MAG: rhomboid family intramembrane serine protease [Candidatus Puniceispirillum sp.]|jgi:membrane associated rhomboid family serine protease|uniref:rhomboid family intramembrane serine protease n=1 Tax=Candidatus Puniceispirillum sp. TaxID=2026719 RepID=UPI001EC3BB83|nr:rhomboid family intramembrane serine protease [Candidatus Puniceispirillum sp.]MBT6415665.1 rhomboid family intramembrane serine protease [Candidatus Puniceispirillum sp.]MBT6566410.1 rhomboid family intramembrane serine protease [Candidatus Puniceispirillum sp.]